MQRDYTVKQAADKLAITEGRVRVLIAAKRLKARHIGSIYLIRESDLRAFQALDRKPGRPRKNAAVDASEKGARDGDETN